MSLAVTNHSNAHFSQTTAGTIAYTTSVADEIVVLAISSERGNTGGSIPVLSVTDTNGLTWHLRTSFHYVGIAQVNTDNTIEEWWAHAAGAISGTITVTMASAIDAASMVTMSVSGCTNFTNPYASGILPQTNFNADVPETVPTATMTTPDSNSLIFGIIGEPVNNAFTAGTGFVIQDTALNNGGAIGWSNCFVEAAAFTAAQTALAVAFVGPGGHAANWGLVVDALSAVGGGGLPPVTRSFGTVIN